MWRVDVLQPDGTIKREQRSKTFVDLSERAARAAFQQPILDSVNAANGATPAVPKRAGMLSSIIREWREQVAGTLKLSTRKSVESHFRRHIEPLLGDCDLSRQAFSECDLSNPSLYWTPVSIDCEAVEQAGAANALQCFGTTSRRAMGRVPRGIAATIAVGVADLSATSRAARPIAAGVVGVIGEGSAIGLRAGQHVVRVGLISDAVVDLPLLRNVCLFAHVVTQPRLLDGVTVQVTYIFGNARPFGVIPRAGADAVASINCHLTARSLRTQVRMPGFTGAPGSLRKRLTVRVRASQSA